MGAEGTRTPPKARRSTGGNGGGKERLSETRAPEPLGDIAVVTVILHRKDDTYDIEHEFCSSKTEAWAILERAARILDDEVSQ